MPIKSHSLDDLAARMDALSPAKRKLLELRLKKQGALASVEQKIARRATHNSAPLSFTQQQLWFLNQLEPESPAYNQPKATRLKGLLNVEALQKALDQIVVRHEVLRTTFVPVDGIPAQVVADGRTAELTVIDLRACPDTTREAEVHRVLVEASRRPFDLSRDLMLRSLLLRLDNQEHILLVVTHHIASDGWSTGILWRELTALYRAFGSGEPSPLRELPIQYADYAVWQRNWLQGDVLENQISYWKKQLSDVSVLELPTDRTRPGVQAFRGTRQSFVLSKILSDELRTLSRKEGVTLFMTLLAAFQSLLHRYTGQEDIAVGSPIANRTRSEIEGLIGFFVNTLALRTDLSGNPSFRELLTRVRAVALGAYEHQDLPFEKLVEELNPERRLGQTPLFQVMFVLQNTPRKPAEIPGVEVSPVEVSIQTAKFDLTLSITESADSLRGVLEYNTDLFEEATIRRMAGHFQTLLHDIAAHPDRRISELSLLTETERAQLLVEWNDTEREYPKDLCIHDLFETQAERSPDAVAVVFEDKQLTYRELNARANQLARQLRRLGVRSATSVAICMNRSLEMMVGLLGILKAGGAYLPLDPAYPKDRLSFMLEDAQVLVLLTEERLVEDLPEYRARVMCLDRDWGDTAGESEENFDSRVTGQNLAYLIYTSGSTGTPKAVTMSHRSLCNLICWQIHNFTWSIPARTLQFASLSFDVSFQEIFTTWCSGGTLLLISEELRRDAAGLLHFLRDESVERLFLPYIALQQLAEAAENERVVPTKLREVITAGEQLQITRQIANLFTRLKDCTLQNQYGPSESHVVTTYTLTGSPTSWPALPAIGRPIANINISILDRYLNPVPIGVPGELHIGGAGLACGYLNRQELTAEKFIPHPFSEEPGARLYKTGDRARYLPDGNIEFLERIDDQRKIRGYRIELGEIEVTLAQHSSVRESAVVAREDGPGGRRLVAYVVASQDPDPSTNELRSFLTQKLPDYMVPSSFVFLEALPLTPNGKVDRRALPPPDQSRPELGQAFVAPRTPTEELLVGIWAEVLKLEKVGIHDNFFDLGGHSLLATQVVSRVRQAFQMELPLRSLFESPTVTGLAERIEETRRGKMGLQVLPILPMPRDGDLPLSFAQQRVWFIDQLEPNSSVYNVPSGLRLKGPLDIGALEQSLNEIVRRHEALRTTFSMVEGEPVQVISPSLSVPLLVVDLTDHPESEREDEARRLSREEARRPFDLSRGPLLRVSLLRLSEQDHVLLLTMHHIVSDGWSMGVLFRELSVLYEAFSNEQPSPLPSLPIQYADFSVWQRNWLQGEVLESQLSYWKKQLEGAPAVLNLPTDRSCTAVQSHRGARQSIVVCEELTQSLKALSRKQGVTLL